MILSRSRFAAIKSFSIWNVFLYMDRIAGGKERMRVIHYVRECVRELCSRRIRASLPMAGPSLEASCRRSSAMRPTTREQACQPTLI